MPSVRGLLALLLIALPGALAAEVSLDVRADGVKVMRNEPAVARERRLSGRLLALPSTKLAELVERWAGERELDPRLVQAVMQVESGYNPKALSDKGAIGLMQLMPGTARELSVDDPWDPDQNVRGGTQYLKQMLDFFSGDLELALAAYNAGARAVLENAGIPPYPDTRAYVRRVRCLFDGSCDDDGADSGRDGRKVRIERGADNTIRITTVGPGG
jgi:soluble lytic murein transglycosylase